MSDAHSSLSSLPLSVVITTYNRSHLIGRAIQSALQQKWPDLEVLVVDDASTDATADLVRGSFPQVRYVRQEANRGLCAARNRGIREASRSWVMFLDDDDSLKPGALEIVRKRLAEFPERERFPLLQFARSNCKLPAEFLILRLEHYLASAVTGDCATVLRKDLFLAEGLSEPEFLRNGDGLLLWRIARKYGIPTWADPIQTVHTDAAARATSAEYQLRNARDYAELQEYILREFGGTLEAQFPGSLEKRRLGAATYRLLANQPEDARAHLRIALQRRMSGPAMALWALSFLPPGVGRKCFGVYRRHAQIDL